jgi:hypothetical protein
MNRDTAVGIVTGYRLDNQGVGVGLGGGMNFDFCM